MALFKILYSLGDQEYSMPLERRSTAIGRAPDQDIVLAHPAVSRRHAVILRDNDGYRLIDQGSTHGTFVNGIRVTETGLAAGDSIRLGASPGLELRVRDPHQSTSSAPSSSHLATQKLIASLQVLSAASNKTSEVAPEIAQLNWLLSAARLLNEIGGIDDILNALLKSTLELTGFERGFVFIQEDGELQFKRGRDSSGNDVEDNSTISRRALKHAVSTTAAFTIGDTSSDHRAADWSSVKAHNIRNIYCIPLRNPMPTGGNGELLGLLYLDSRIGTPHGANPLTPVDRQIVEMIATEASALLQNALLTQADQQARRAREELAVAARIHSGLMATELPQLPFARFQAKSLPCLAIGGDFFDAIPLGDCVGVSIADVSGKGVSAAIVAAILQGIIHAQLLSGQSLPEIASLVNRFLCARNVGKYATMVLVKLFADGRMEYINCGHVQPVTIFEDAGQVTVRHLEESNLVVGLLPEAVYRAGETTLRPGERIFLATDGVTEAEDPQGIQFAEHLPDCLSRLKDLDEILLEVLAFQAQKGRQFVGGDFSDDCTMLQIEYRGTATGPVETIPVKTAAVERDVVTRRPEFETPGRPAAAA
jgi:serine phosphatase RsbU (regulator of sigma subunit)